MELQELKTRLQMEQTETANDAYLQLQLNDAIEWVQRVCNQSFIVDYALTLPNTAKSVVAQYVAFEMQGNAGIKSESIGGMSQTFDSATERNQSLISKLSAAGLRKVRFVPFGGR
ncbi:phage head-tail connector protein [Solibacillus sp. FSL H8-0523]|uniref:phage head-tail connector protein n=1 Tax=Solibacillus sp. FSL H8-0523 TaxID=2954511 RepID=UPI003101681C